MPKVRRILDADPDLVPAPPPPVDRLAFATDVMNLAAEALAAKPQNAVKRAEYFRIVRARDPESCWYVESVVVEDGRLVSGPTPASAPDVYGLTETKLMRVAKALD